MKKVELPLSELMGIAATRGLLGAGIAFLVSDCLTREQRRRTGVLLTTIGVLSTIPFLSDISRRCHETKEPDEDEPRH
jgi:hypothetical protein